jgi:hypothetical protein
MKSLFVLLAVIVVGSRTQGQPESPSYVLKPCQIHSGMHSGSETQASSSAAYKVRIQEKGVDWMRLIFGDCFLSGQSFIRISSVKDGAHQELDNERLSTWHNTSMYFNGDAVDVELHLVPGDLNSFFTVKEVMVPGNSILVGGDCGGAPRYSSNIGAVGRIGPNGGTAFIALNGLYVTAWHVLHNETAPVLMFKIQDNGGNPTDQNDQYPVQTATITHGSDINGGAEDWAIFRVANNPSGEQPIQRQHNSYGIEQPDASNPTLRVIGYGVLYDSASPKWATQRYGDGARGSDQYGVLSYRVPGTNGNSGSPVVNTSSGKVWGIFALAGCSSIAGENSGPSMSNSNLWNALNAFSNVTVNQLRGGTQTSAGVDRWEYSTGDGYSNPILNGWFGATFATKSAGSTVKFRQGGFECLRGFQQIESGSKYNKWNTGGVDQTDVRNHHLFWVDQSFPLTVTSQFTQTMGGSTIKIDLIDLPGSYSGTLQFKDPWLIDFADPFLNNQLRNQGMNAPFYPVSAPFSISFASSYKGVFLGLDPSQGFLNYYSVNALSSQSTFNGYAGYFGYWTATNAHFQNSLSAQTALVFDADNAVVTANYKGIHLSNSTAAFSNNSQKKFVRTPDTYLHLVYESAGHVWYERSTDGGTTWTFANNSKPLDSQGAKLPAIDCSDNKIGIVWQERSGGIAQLRVARFEGLTMSQYYPLEVFINTSTPYTQNLNPVIAYNNDGRAIIAWENKNTMQYGGYNYVPGIALRYGVLGYLPTPPNWTTIDQKVISSTDVNCTNPTISVAKSPADPHLTQYFHIAWQYTQSSQYSYVKYCMMSANSSAVTVGSIYAASDGAGFWQNRRPCITVMNDISARLSWDGYTPWYLNRAIYRNINANGTLGGTIFNLGSGNVSQTSINGAADGTFVLGWVETYAPITNNFVKSSDLYAIKNFSTHGIGLQVNNGASFGSMYGMAFLTQSAPYSFAQSSNVGGIPKSTPKAVFTGRAVVASSAGRQFVCGIGDLLAGGQPVQFVPLPDDAFSGGRDSFGQFLKSQDFLVSADGDVSLTVFHGMVNPYDTTDVVDFTEDGQDIDFQVVLVDAKDGSVIKELGDYAVAKKHEFATQAVSYLLTFPKSAMSRSARAEIRVTNRGSAQYTVVDAISNAQMNASADVKPIAELLSMPEEKVASFEIGQNFPNPFNPVTRISYKIPDDGRVSIILYDQLGREVSRVLDQYQTSGRYTIEFDGSRLASGIYFYSIRAGKHQEVRKMILVK